MLCIVCVSYANFERWWIFRVYGAMVPILRRGVNSINGNRREKILTLTQISTRVQAVFSSP